MPLTISFALGFPAGVFMAVYEPASLGASGAIVGADHIVVLEPDTWVGKTFPLFAHIDIGDRLAEGRWRLLFFHQDCPQCQKAVAYYEHLTTTSEGAPALALVNVTPLANLLPSIAAIPNVNYGFLDAANDWFVATPVAVTLDDGVVTSVDPPSDISALMQSAHAPDR